MEPIRFADILFVFLTLVITFTILWLVNKARKKSQTAASDDQAQSGKTVVSDKGEG